MEKDEFETVGWANLSQSGKALIITIDEKRVGLISLQSLGKCLNGTNKACPITLPVKKLEKSPQEMRLNVPELKPTATTKNDVYTTEVDPLVSDGKK